MMIIDAHLHLDDSFDGTAAGAAKELDRQLNAAGISGAIVLHLETQAWSTEEVAQALSKYSGLKGFINIHPHNTSAVQLLRDGITRLKYAGLKLHPRLQVFSIEDKETIKLAQEAGKLGVPVLIDAFPDGTHLMQGFSPVKYAVLAKHCPDTNFIWGHMGGHYVLDFMMLAKRLPNVYMDFSYSLLYYQGSAVVDNLIYSMRSMKFDRIFYGSDYPDRSIEISLNTSLDILRAKGVSEDDLKKIMGQNIAKLLSWSPQK